MKMDERWWKYIKVCSTEAKELEGSSIRLFRLEGCISVAARHSNTATPRTVEKYIDKVCLKISGIPLKWLCWCPGWWSSLGIHGTGPYFKNPNHHCKLKTPEDLEVVETSLVSPHWIFTWMILQKAPCTIYCIHTYLNGVQAIWLHDSRIFQPVMIRPSHTALQQHVLFLLHPNTQRTCE